MNSVVPMSSVVEPAKLVARQVRVFVDSHLDPNEVRPAELRLGTWGGAWMQRQTVPGESDEAFDRRSADIEDSRDLRYRHSFDTIGIDDSSSQLDWKSRRHPDC